MPHVQIDCSANLAALCRALHDAAVEAGVFPLAGVRLRAMACDHWVIADGDPQHAVPDISVRLRGGRPDAVKARATAHLFAAAKAFCADLLATWPGSATAAS